jgi:DNA repair exonuclease SbcCD nuclease subunit
MKLFHAADIHLGRRRLDGRLPDDDIARAFAYIADQAIAESADVFLLAGDLFDRPQVEPPHLQQAITVLRKLKAAGIPVVVVEGNHDRAFVHTETPTWVDYLGQEDLLILLKPRFNADGAVLQQWDAATKTGAWIHLKGVRFTGAGYLGAATPNKLRQIVTAIEKGPCHVLLLHAGPEYFVGEGGGFSSADLNALKGTVRYLALGHIHKPFLVENWACNPGSPENCDVREAKYGEAGGKIGARGFAVVTIDPANPAPPVAVEIRNTPRRPCIRVDLDCTPFGNKTKHGDSALVDAAAKLIATLKPAPETVIDLRLSGFLNLNRIAFDPVVASEQIREKAKVFAVSIDTTGINVAGGGTAGAVGDAGLSREEIEKKAIRTLVQDDALWGLTAEADAFSALFFDLKEAVRQGHSGEILTEQIAQSPLVDRIRTAKNTAPVPVEQTVAAPCPLPTP